MTKTPRIKPNLPQPPLSVPAESLNRSPAKTSRPFSRQGSLPPLPVRTSQRARPIEGVKNRAEPEFKSRSAPPKSPVQDIKLLIIDDDPARLDALAIALRDLGAEVAVGGRGKSGLTQAARILPDAVISDLASPGERGWWLVQRLRTHPLLRWTPVLLLRWWNENSEGETQVLLEKILSRLDGLLAPSRNIASSLKKTPSVSERIETTGPLALLRGLSRTNLSGLLTVNDAFSIFELDFDRGTLRSIVRRGVDGASDSGEDAFFQLLLCDTGRWTFRKAPLRDVEQNIDQTVDSAAKTAGGLLSTLFGGIAKPDDKSGRTIRIDLGILKESLSTLSVSAERIADALLSGVDEASLDALLRDLSDPFEIDRALQMLFRCGALKFDSEIKGSARGPEAQEAIRVITYIFAHKPIAEPPGAAFDDIEREDLEKHGMYFVSHVKPERLTTAKREALTRAEDTPTEDPAINTYEEGFTPEREERTPLEPMDLGSTPALPHDRPTLDLYEPGSSETRPQSSIKWAQTFLRRLIHDSLVPSAKDRPSSNKQQMWLAIILAVLLGGMVIAGLIFVASEGSDDTPVETGNP